MATRILLGGVGKSDVASKIREIGDEGLEAKITNDMDAAMKLREGQAEYFFGTCHTGAGGSLGVLVGLLGNDKCMTFRRGLAREEIIRDALDEGKVAFGFSVDQIDQVVPALVRGIREREEQR
jgi:hypothetical protein